MNRKLKQELTDRFFPGTEPVIGDIIRRSPLTHDKIVINIPARAGSNRISEKNIKPLCGKPLMAYSILMAKALGVDRVMVSTDSEKFAEIAREYGAEVPFLRPEALASAHVSPGVVSYYMMKRLLHEGYPVGTWIELLPTTPFRNLERMREYLGILDRSGNIATVFSPAGTLSDTYCDGEPVDVRNAEALRDSHCFYKLISCFLGNKLSLQSSRWRQYVQITDPVELIDIDTEEDFLLAEDILASGCYDFGIDVC